MFVWTRAYSREREASALAQADREGSRAKTRSGGMTLFQEQCKGEAKHAQSESSSLASVKSGGVYLLSLDDSYFMAITLPSMCRPLVKLQSWMLDFDHKQSSHMNGSGMGRKPTQKQ